MARTTPSAVAGIIEVDPAIDLAPFIETAAVFVDEIAADSAAPPEARLEIIERWLAAHFYATRDPRAAAEGAGGVSATYQNAVAVGFENSHYGQVAVRLDPTGLLARQGRPAPVAAGYWLGKECDGRG